MELKDYLQNYPQHMNEELGARQVSELRQLYQEAYDTSLKDLRLGDKSPLLGGNYGLEKLYSFIQGGIKLQKLERGSWVDQREFGPPDSVRTDVNIRYVSKDAASRAVYEHVVEELESLRLNPSQFDYGRHFDRLLDEIKGIGTIPRGMFGRFAGAIDWSLEKYVDNVSEGIRYNGKLAKRATIILTSLEGTNSLRLADLNREVLKLRQELSAFSLFCV